MDAPNEQDEQEPVAESRAEQGQLAEQTQPASQAPVQFAETHADAHAEASGQPKQHLDLLTLVIQPTWREFLTDLVAREKMDPWDVDVCAVADAYLGRLRSLQAMDLRVPANVILACSILLRLKANTLLIEDEDDSQMGEAAPQLIEEEIPNLVLRPDRPRSRRVTLSELLNAVEDVMRVGKRFTPLPPGLAQVLELETPTENMGERMQHVLGQAQELKDAEGLLMFSALVQSARGKLNGRAPPRYADSVISHLIPVLHLVQEQKLAAWQDEFFGEIFLRLIDVEEEKRKEQALLAAKAEESASAI